MKQTIEIRLVQDKIAELEEERAAICRQFDDASHILGISVAGDPQWELIDDAFSDMDYLITKLAVWLDSQVVWGDEVKGEEGPPPD